MSQAFTKNETEGYKQSINAEESSEKSNDLKIVLSKDLNQINHKNIFDLNGNKSINDFTKSKISKMELDIEVFLFKYNFKLNGIYYINFI